MFAAIVLIMSAAVYANPSNDYGRKGASVSEEIQNLLDESNLVIEESFKVRVIFSLSEDKKIRIHSVSSPNEEEINLLRKDLPTGNYLVPDGRQVKFMNCLPR